MKRKPLFNLVLGILVIIVLSACSGQDSDGDDLSDAVAQGVAATLTKQAWNDELESAHQTEEAAEQEEEMATPEPIVHVIFPDYSPGSNTFVSDFSSLDYAPEKTTPGDYFQMNRMERPFSAEDMEYIADLDIIRVNLKADSPWFYATFILAGDLRDEGNIHYALEFDLDTDGRGDFLVWAVLPSDSEWTTDGVQVLEDADDDVGGVYPLQMEDPNPDLNGYEKTIFDAGVGDDPDLAWIRRDPEETKQLQIAFKESIVGSDGFLWSAWADDGLMDPALFDYNDQFTLEDAGSPHNENQEYPLKLVYQVDSTCRSWYGMTPIGTEPGLCAGEYADQPGDGNGDGNGDDNGNGNGNGDKLGSCVMGTDQSGAPVCGPCLPTCPRDQNCIACVLP